MISTMIQYSRNTFAPKLFIKLQENNFLLWNQQVEGVILSHKLHKIVGNLHVASMFKTDTDRLANIVYEEYEAWRESSYTLCMKLTLYSVKFTISSVYIIQRSWYAWGSWKMRKLGLCNYLSLTALIIFYMLILIHFILFCLVTFITFYTLQFGWNNKTYLFHHKMSKQQNNIFTLFCSTLFYSLLFHFIPFILLYSYISQKNTILNKKRCIQNLMVT